MIIIIMIIIIITMVTIIITIDTRLSAAFGAGGDRGVVGDHVRAEERLLHLLGVIS